MSRARIAVAIQKATASRALPDDASIRRWVCAAAEGQPAGEITVRLVDEPESAELNARYRQRAYPTNVLSFAADPFPAESFPAERFAVGAEEGSADAQRLPLGDLVVCAPVVEREAAEQHKALEAHWAHILVHGCLHLFGHDHETEPEAEAMEARERRVLGRFGFPDPYEIRGPESQDAALARGPRR